jgi:hypothetical protein
LTYRIYNLPPNDLEFLLSSLGFEDLRSIYDSKQLLATANQIHPEWVDSVAGKIDNFQGWASVGSNFTIGRIYGLDYIIQVQPTDDRIGFKFATNPNAVRDSIEKAQTLYSLWKSLGVSKVIVLLAIYPVRGESLVFYDKDRAQDKLLSLILDAIDGTSEVSSAEIHLQIE